MSFKVGDKVFVKNFGDLQDLDQADKISYFKVSGPSNRNYTTITSYTDSKEKIEDKIDILTSEIMLHKNKMPQPGGGLKKKNLPRDNDIDSLVALKIAEALRPGPEDYDESREMIEMLQSIGTMEEEPEEIGISEGKLKKILERTPTKEKGKTIQMKGHLNIWGDVVPRIRGGPPLRRKKSVGGRKKRKRRKKTRKKQKKHNRKRRKKTRRKRRSIFLNY
jgi:hypothetical protein